MNKADLKLDWCSHEAAKYACEKWHYSGCIPKAKLAKVGVWECTRFIGAVIFGCGACPQIAKPFGLKQTEVCELVRVALTKHETPVSRIVAIASRLLSRSMPGIRIVVSYADPEQGHNGGIYQAGNWIYCGHTKPTEWFEDCETGERIHSHVYRRGKRGRATADKAAGIIRAVKLVKHKYLMPFDAEIRARIEPLRKPYPKRERSADSGTPGNQSGRGGAIPTRSLQTPGGEG
jgi:antitoxin (DNA-binding transcriptional repressor) of toxin-antitoxin stability system